MSIVKQNVNGGTHQMMMMMMMMMRDLEEMLSKLNPMAEEFVPPSLVNYKPFLHQIAAHFGYVSADNGFVMQLNSPVANGISTTRKKTGYGHAKKRVNSMTSVAQREEIIRRTVYVCDIDQQVTEEQLATLFIGCGQVVDCRVCGDPNSVLRFAFIEFMDRKVQGMLWVLLELCLVSIQLGFCLQKLQLHLLIQHFYHVPKMKGRCVQEQSIEQISIRRLLKQISNSFLSISVERLRVPLQH
ncbi:polyadenylate-binding protein-interacting protein 12-like isoform X1 [Apium graveolens]|uniref:polyadenylate-binding protein-interacting protein 12-like isoform X1 n=1 Tax=Apium graveolens TaxID=4045 RepID=UPI003D7A3B14